MNKLRTCKRSPKKKKRKTNLSQQRVGSFGFYLWIEDESTTRCLKSVVQVYNFIVSFLFPFLFFFFLKKEIKIETGCSNL